MTNIWFTHSRVTSWVSITPRILQKLISRNPPKNLVIWRPHFQTVQAGQSNALSIQTINLVLYMTIDTPTILWKNYNMHSMLSLWWRQRIWLSQRETELRLNNNPVFWMVEQMSEMIVFLSLLLSHYFFSWPTHLDCDRCLVYSCLHTPRLCTSTHRHSVILLSNWGRERVRERERKKRGKKRVRERD